ncbi:tandem-95 repeat protein [Pseudomonas stutzeri]|nr:tandem-95 repeat protein [Stutzerimonas stutzeri]
MNDAPLANDDSLAATEDTPVTFAAADLLGNDSDVDGDSLSIASVTSGGTGGTAVLNADGTVTFTPDADFNGVATFSYTVTDGNLVSNTATVTVNVAPGSYTYTPPADFHGTDTVDYTVTDGSLTDTATLTLTVTPVNDAPVAQNDAVTAGATLTVTVAVLETRLPSVTV